MIDLRAFLSSDALPVTIPDKARLTLIAVALDNPLAYIFESADWKSAIGAARLVQVLGDQIRSALPTGSMLLSGSEGQSQWLALTQNPPPDWSEVARITPAITGILTASVTGISLTARQIYHGLYRNPTTTIGIPGLVAPQTRVNRYYGVAGGSAVPEAEQIAEKRHFGEALSLIAHQIHHMSEDRDIFPYYECLPLVERCEFCRLRPAETIAHTFPICGICRRKRQAAGSLTELRGGLAVVVAQAIGIDGRPAEALLREQTTPFAYVQTTRALMGAWSAIDRAIDRSLPAIPLWRSEIESWWVTPASQAMAFAATIGKKVSASSALWSDEIPRMTVHIGVGVDHRRSGASDFGGASDTYRSAVNALQQSRDGSARVPLKLEIAISALEIPSGKPLRYPPDSAVHIQAAVQTLQSARFQASPFSDLSQQVEQRTANLYFDSVRSRLDNRSRQTLDAIVTEFSSVWGKQTDQLFTALSDTFALLEATNAPATDRS